jgi:hypothetical protein
MICPVGGASLRVQAKMPYLIPILSVLALCAGACGDAEVPRASATRAEPGCSLDNHSLSLTSVQKQRIHAARTPSSVASDSSGILLAIDGRLAGLAVHSPESATARWVPAPEVLTSVAHSGSEFFVAGSRTIYRVYLEPDRVEVVARVPLRSGSIVSMVADEARLWVAAAGEGGHAELLSAPRGPGMQWRRRMLSGPVRVESASRGRVAVAAISPPHSVWVFDSVLARRGSTSPPAGYEPNAAEALYTQALVRLDCDRVLQLLADLRSDRRTFHLYSTAGELSLIRSRTVDQPLGLVHAIPGQKLVVGVSEGRGWWEADWLRWSWTRTGGSDE